MPPPGPAPTRVAELLAVAISMSVIVVLFVPLRLWVRGFMVGSIGADDWCIGIATVRVPPAAGGTTPVLTDPVRRCCRC